MPVKKTLQKAKSCFDFRRPEKKSTPKFGYSIDPSPSITTFASDKAGLLESDGGVPTLTSTRSIDDSDVFVTPRTAPSTAITTPEKVVEQINEVMADVSPGYKRSLSKTQDVYLPPKVSRAAPSLPCLRPVSVFDMDWIEDDRASLRGDNTDHDAALGESLRMIVTQHNARDDNSRAHRNAHGNLTLFPPITPQTQHKPVILRSPDSEFDVHPAFRRGKKEARDAGRAPSKHEVKEEKKSRFKRLLRHVAGRDELKKRNEDVAAQGNSTFAYFRG
ncbi:uncharacterized protein BKA78DRAFT_357799 [Phyllosticta capitalensis]|uniref:uncharacterized protein n=1 Tax=Phyllosticta capitalensis TaxID=121624 RepID=UPI00312D12FA